MTTKWLFIALEAMQDSSVTELDLGDAQFGDHEVKSISESLQDPDTGCAVDLNKNN